MVTIGVVKQENNGTLPDTVLKYGEVIIVGTNATIAANEFQWRLKKVEFLTPPAFTTPVAAATTDFYRSDLIVGDNTGNYHLVQGTENEFAAPEPEVPDGMIKLALIPVFGDTIGAPEYDLSQYATKEEVQFTDEVLDSRLTDLENQENLQTGFTGKAYAIWAGSGFSYDVVLPAYYLQSILYPASVTRITLDAADPTNPRYDIFAANSTGAIKKTGTPGPNPVAPTVDTTTELFITFVPIGAGATQPDNTNYNAIYLNNSEYTTSKSGGTTNFNNGTDQFDGAACIEVPSSQRGTVLTFEKGSVDSITNYTELAFRLKTVIPWVNSDCLEFQFFNGATAASSVVQYFRKNIAGPNNITYPPGYNYIVLPIGSFNFNTAPFDRLKITIKANQKFFLDNIILTQSGGGVSGNPTPAEINLAALITAAPEKTTIADNDKIGIADSEDADKTKFWKWSTIKNTLKTWFDTQYEKLTNKSQDIETDKTSTDKYGSVKAVYDWAVGKLKTWVLAINPQAGITYTFGVNDYKNRTVFTSTNPVTVTIPTNAVTPYAIGTKIEYTQKGAGVVTIGGAGVTITTNLSLASVLGETRTLTKIDTDEWTLEGSIVAPVSKTSNTYFVDTVLGNNTSGVFENPAKPFASIDYVLGLSLTTNVRIVLLNAATHNLTTTIPININVTIESNVKVTLDISSNANATIMNNTVLATELTINLPLGKLYNNRSGGTGSIMASNKTIQNIILKELYWNSSTAFISVAGNPTSVFYLNIQKIQSAVVTYAGFIQCDNGKGYIEKIAEFVCLANGCTLNAYGVLMDIALISGAGYARFGEQYSPQSYIIGDIKTTGTCSFTGYAHVTFVNSVITSANGISSGDGYAYDIVFTGAIRSVAKIASASQHQANCWIGFINFRANFGAGYLNTWRGNIYFENCSITCNSYLISSAANSGGGGDFIFKNTTIQQVTPTNLISGVAAETRTITIGGLTTNATAISNQDGTGHTITYMTNY